MKLVVDPCPACNGKHEFAGLPERKHTYSCENRTVFVSGVRTHTSPQPCTQWSWFHGPYVHWTEDEGANGITVNALGGKQSDTGTRFDLMPPKAIHEVAKVLKRGAEKYGENNWHAIPTREHLEHLIRHAYLWLDGDTSEDHLANVACRGLMALEIQKRGGPKAKEEGS